ncbi:hypothetical protein GGX14DRAFT_389281 [Mycena pura]|uniref:Secreted protein n=1 Tax=Mycena pura TaxID=153505 RepID=A0AAD6VS28_9AGAR|nr:hypothetical protein GGX14DRAFT_389281 [Mycena pura]
MFVLQFLWLLFLLSRWTPAFGRLVNVTLDDTSTAITYTHPLLRCMPRTCPAGSTEQLYNGTSTTTTEPITLRFIGVAVYVYLGVEDNCTFSLDGDVVGNYSRGETDPTRIYVAYVNTTLDDAPHELSIYPTDQGVREFIELDYIVYTYGCSPLPRIDCSPVIQAKKDSQQTCRCHRWQRSGRGGSHSWALRCVDLSATAAETEKDIDTRKAAG